MPVLSPHRSSSSALTGSYRSSLGTSALDRPFYGGASSYGPRYSYSERYTSRSYIDSDGRKVISRSGSITEDGITSRFREETRENSVTRRDSLSRDSGISSIRENSILDTSRKERDPSVTRLEGRRESSYTPLNVAESLADLRNKYSPANYVPAVYRNKENISRSKSINDIGLPPIETKGVAKKKVNDGLSFSNSLGLSELANNTNSLAENNDNMYIAEDDNGNRQPVSEIRKKFERISKSKSPLIIEGKTKKPEAFERSSDEKNENLNGDAFVDKRPPAKQSKLENEKSKSEAIEVDRQKDEEQNNLDSSVIKNSDSDLNSLERRSKFTVPGRKEIISNGVDFGGNTESTSEASSSEVKVNGEISRNTNSRVNNFSSYIPAKDYEKGDVVNGTVDSYDIESENSNLNNKYGGKSRLLQDKTSSDLSTSPRLNRALSHQNATSSSTNTPSTSNNINSNSIARNSLERDRRDYEDDRNYIRIGCSPVKQQGLNGLKNIGNTCFMNSVIQCLSNTKPLLEYVRKDMYISDINTSISSMKGALIKAFSQVIKELWSEDSSDRVVNTVALKTQIQRFAPRFIGYSQQDAQEFLRYLLEGLHEDVNRVITKPAPILTEIDEKLSDSEKSSESWQRYLRIDNSKIVDIFVGQLKSTLRCTYCGHCSVTFDPFWDLSLPIPQKVGPVRLQQCLDSFTREETLDGDEKPTCSKCKERRKCTKSFSIQKFPKILVIHLKRFSPTERFRGKLSVNVDFPAEGLDMSNYAADSHTQSRYNLYAISNHSGTTYSGHYTAYCRHPYSLAWHEYNDSRVSSISPKSIVSGEAYVLFYELDSQKAHL